MSRINLWDFEAAARESLDRLAWDYFASGAGDEVTLRENRAAFDRYAIHHRVLAGSGSPRVETTLLGRRIDFPVLVAPTAFHRLAHPTGEVSTARAAAHARTIMVLSTLSTTRVEDVTPELPEALWFQLYLYKDRATTRALVERVTAAGCSALVLTVDVPRLGRRERDIRNRFALPPGLRAENLTAAGKSEASRVDAGSGLAAYFESLLEPDLSWTDLDWLSAIANVPVLVKGIVRADDALRAIEHGAAGVIVSNHGGRQLDGSPATLDALPAVADAVAGRGEILMDGGIRRGADVLKALGLGARAVLVGRPIVWGLAADGRRGVEAVLEILRSEFELALALAGCADAARVDRDLVRPVGVRPGNGSATRPLDESPR